MDQTLRNWFWLSIILYCNIQKTHSDHTKLLLTNSSQRKLIFRLQNFYSSVKVILPKFIQIKTNKVKQALLYWQFPSFVCRKFTSVSCQHENSFRFDSNIRLHWQSPHRIGIPCSPPPSEWCLLRTHDVKRTKSFHDKLSVVFFCDEQSSVALAPYCVQYRVDSSMGLRKVSGVEFWYDCNQSKVRIGLYFGTKIVTFKFCVF